MNEFEETALRIWFSLLGERPQEHPSDCVLEFARRLVAKLAKPASEPVAWMWDEATYRDGDVRGRCWSPQIGRQKPGLPWMTRNIVPLYTHPPTPSADCVVVPRKTTVDMQHAGVEAAQNSENNEQSWGEYVYRIYAAMLSAAPNAAAQVSSSIGRTTCNQAEPASAAPDATPETDALRKLDSDARNECDLQETMIKVLDSHERLERQRNALQVELDAEKTYGSLQFDELQDVKAKLKEVEERRRKDISTVVTIVSNMNAYTNFQSKHDYHLITCTIDKIRAAFPGDFE